MTSSKSPSSSSSNYFNLFVSGQIVSASFPLGSPLPEIFCRYESIAGPDWELVSGIQHGITQIASKSSGSFQDPIVFNMPIELVYRSTNPHGWPQLLLSVYGKTRWGIDNCLGYSHLHLPVFTRQDQGKGVEDHNIRAAILRPRCSNLLASLTSWLTGRNPELRDPQTLLNSGKVKDLIMDSYGELHLILNVISRGTMRLGLEY